MSEWISLPQKLRPKELLCKGDTSELNLERLRPIISNTFLLQLIAFRLIPPISPSTRAEQEDYWNQGLSRNMISKSSEINSWKPFSGSVMILVPTRINKMTFWTKFFTSGARQDYVEVVSPKGWKRLLPGDHWNLTSEKNIGKGKESGCRKRGVEFKGVAIMTETVETVTVVLYFVGQAQGGQETEQSLRKTSGGKHKKGVVATGMNSGDTRGNPYSSESCSETSAQLQLDWQRTCQLRALTETPQRRERLREGGQIHIPDIEVSIALWHETATKIIPGELCLLFLRDFFFLEISGKEGLVQGITR